MSRPKYPKVIKKNGKNMLKAKEVDGARGRDRPEKQTKIEVEIK